MRMLDALRVQSECMLRRHGRHVHNCLIKLEDASRLDLFTALICSKHDVDE